jgi:hypothetical protein
LTPNKVVLDITPNHRRTGAMTLPADFPPLPAENARLAVVISWVFDLLMWLVARAAARAGEDGGLTGCPEPPRPASPPPDETEQTGPPGTGETEAPLSAYPPEPARVTTGRQDIGRHGPVSLEEPDRAGPVAEDPAIGWAGRWSAATPRSRNGERRRVGRNRRAGTRSKCRPDRPRRRWRRRAGRDPPSVAGPTGFRSARFGPLSHADIVTMSLSIAARPGAFVIARPASSPSPPGSPRCRAAAGTC